MLERDINLAASSNPRRHTATSGDSIGSYFTAAAVETPSRLAVFCDGRRRWWRGPELAQGTAESRSTDAVEL